MSARRDEAAARSAMEESSEAVAEAQQFYRNMVSMYVDALVEKGYVISKNDLDIYAQAVEEALYVPLAGRITYTGWSAGDDYDISPANNDLFLDDEYERLVKSRPVKRPDYTGELLSVLEASTKRQMAIATGNGACQVIQQSSK